MVPAGAPSGRASSGPFYEAVPSALHLHRTMRLIALCIFVAAAPSAAFLPAPRLCAVAVGGGRERALVVATTADTRTRIAQRTFNLEAELAELEVSGVSQEVVSSLKEELSVLKTSVSDLEDRIATIKACLSLSKARQQQGVSF